MRLEVNSMNEWKDVVCSVFQLKIIIGRKHCDGRKSNWTFESDRSCRLWEIESVRFNRSSLERDSKHQQELVLLGRRCDRCAHQQRTTPSLPSIGLDLLVPKLFGRRFHFFLMNWNTHYSYCYLINSFLKRTIHLDCSIEFLFSVCPKTRMVIGSLALPAKRNHQKSGENLNNTDIFVIRAM